jgi:hypothetical protein
MDKLNLRRAAAGIMLFIVAFLSLIASHLVQRSAEVHNTLLREHKRPQIEREELLSTTAAATLARIDNVLVIDTRSNEEYRVAHLSGALSLPMRGQSLFDMASLIGRIQRARAVVVCGSPGDSNLVGIFQRMVSAANWNSYYCLLSRQQLCETSADGSKAASSK